MNKVFAFVFPVFVLTLVSVAVYLRHLELRYCREIGETFDKRTVYDCRNARTSCCAGEGTVLPRK